MYNNNYNKQDYDLAADVVILMVNDRDLKYLDFVSYYNYFSSQLERDGYVNFSAELFKDVVKCLDSAIDQAHKTLYGTPSNFTTAQEKTKFYDLILCCYVHSKANRFRYALYR